ncbi:mucin-12 [Astyanax mexicanus]|uniref:mucin-12 n=1 Tax=Astyanax mexicanus TaxID=7994 RepID=UPI0020CB66B2|nr:mucin-12 [Astyanax mexicanus]
MWIREESSVRLFSQQNQTLNGPQSYFRPSHHVRRSGRHIHNHTWPSSSQAWPQENTAPSCYFTFVSRAVLWNRGLHQHKEILYKPGPRPPCSRFEAHMRACPGPSRPPCSLSRLPQSGLPQLLQKKKKKKPLSAPKPPGSTENQRHLQCLSDYTRRHFAEPLPSLPASPHPSIASSDVSPFYPSPPAQSETNQEKSPSFSRVSSKQSTPAAHEEEGNSAAPSAEPFSPNLSSENLEDPEGPEVTTPETMTPETPSTPETPQTPATPNSLSDFSHPASSQFSCRTDLSSSFSNAHSVNLSDNNDSDLQDDHDDDDDDDDDDDNGNSDDLEACSSSLSELRFSSLNDSTMAFRTPPVSPQCSLPKFLTSHSSQTSSTSLNPNQESLKFTNHPIHDQNLPVKLTNQTNIDASPSPCHSTPKFQSITLPSSSPVQTQSFKGSDWKDFYLPVLPPITPQQRGNTEAGASLSSQISCSQSDLFADLDAVAPRTGSCLSVDHPDCSDTNPTSPTTDVSPGLAALTVGCDSGDLDSISRVQLLLLERVASVEELESPPELDWSSPLEPRTHYEAGLQVWSVGIPQHYQSTGTYTPMSRTNSSTSLRCFPIGRMDSQSGSPALSHIEDISRSSSSWSFHSSVGSADSCISRENAEHEIKGWEGEESEGSDVMHDDLLHLSAETAADDPTSPLMEDPSLKPGCPARRERPWIGARGRHHLKERRRRRQRKELGEKAEERKSKALQIYSKLQEGNEAVQPREPSSCSRFEDFDFLAKYCIISPEKLRAYESAFEAVDSDGDGYISCFQVLLALKEIIPPELLTEEEEIYVYRILELVDFRVMEGLTDLRLFAVVASLAQKIATLDGFMRSLISKMDFQSLEMKLYKAKQLFLFLMEGQGGGAAATQGYISAEQLLVELKAGGIREEHEAAVRRELRSLRSLDLLDFLAHLPLFILIHNSVIANPLDDSSNL